MREVTAIFEAISAQDEPKVRSLVENDPSLAQAVNGNGISAILWALYHRRQNLADWLAGFHDQLPAFEAAALGKLSTLQEHYETQPGILEAVSADGFTLLHYACFFSQFAVAKWLLDKGANIHAKTPPPSLLSPLHSAVAARATPIVQLLLAAGADPNVQQQGGYTPLMSAASHGELEIMEALIRHGAKINLTDNEGKTARKMAVENHQKDAIELLDSSAQKT